MPIWGGEKQFVPILFSQTRSHLFKNYQMIKTYGFLEYLMKKRSILEKIPADWLLRVLMAIVFLQQGISKIPVSYEDAAVFDLPFLVWWFVALGELGAGIVLIFGGVGFPNQHWKNLTDLVTRFSGFTIGCVMTGVIWIGEPESLVDVLLYDNLHVFLWFGGLYFALRGNKI